MLVPSLVDFGRATSWIFAPRRHCRLWLQF